MTLAEAMETIENWMGLHQAMDVFSTDGYVVNLTDRDGDRLLYTAEGETLEAAFCDAARWIEDHRNYN